MFKHHYRVSGNFVRMLDTRARKMTVFLSFEGTYPIIPPTATNTPMTDLSPTARPDVIQPKATIEHVFT